MKNLWNFGRILRHTRQGREREPQSPHKRAFDKTSFAVRRSSFIVHPTIHPPVSLGPEKSTEWIRKNYGPSNHANNTRRGSPGGEKRRRDCSRKVQTLQIPPLSVGGHRLPWLSSGAEVLCATPRLAATRTDSMSRFQSQCLPGMYTDNTVRFMSQVLQGWIDGTNVHQKGWGDGWNSMGRDGME